MYTNQLFKMILVKLLQVISFDVCVSIFRTDNKSDGMSSRLNEIYQQLEAIEADKAPARAGVILAGLGFTPKMQSRRTK